MASRQWGTYGDLRLAWLSRIPSALIDYGPPGLLFLAGQDYGWQLQLIAMGLILGNSGVVQGVTGWSVGKLAMGTQLGLPVRWPGDPDMTLAFPGVGRCLIRTLIHIVTFPVLIFLGLQLLGMLLGHCHRSWGDFAVKTIVVSRQDRLELEHKEYGQVSAMSRPAPVPVDSQLNPR
jgi:hypothetical protein